MNNSPTPRTDALRIPSEALLLLGQKGVPEKVVQAILALGEHARQLERENAALRAQNEAMHDDLHEHDEKRHWAEVKVAELREALGNLRQQCEETGFRGVNGLWVVGQIDAMLKSPHAQERSEPKA